LTAIQFILRKLCQDIQDTYAFALLRLQATGMEGLGHAVQTERPELFFDFFNGSAHV
jgi:hypothetical protein